MMLWKHIAWGQWWAFSRGGAPGGCVHSPFLHHQIRRLFMSQVGPGETPGARSGEERWHQALENEIKDGRLGRQLGCAGIGWK